MPLEFLQPKPGAKVQVIGAGLPRTGTNSFCAALSILLDGPTYHAGVQWGTGTKDESHILTMIEAAGDYPYNSDKKRQTMLRKLSALLDGYVAAADPPLSILFPELMELYPDAKVIVTVRNRDTWVKSMLDIVKTSQPALAGFLFFWIPSVRWLPKFANALTNIFYQRYGCQMTDSATCIQTWERHHQLLEETVTNDRLFYVDVKDGWAPLCKALDVPIPDVPFPRLNDAKDLEQHFKNLAVQGLLRWVITLMGLGTAVLAMRFLLY